MNIEIGHYLNELGKPGRPVLLDVEKLLDTRLLVQGSSGCGKSWLIRGLVEQVAPKVQTIILDPEGEFVTLRERLDMVLVGRGGEVPAEPRAAALLARKLKELRTSAVVDLYDLHLADRRRFVRLFLESLLALPRALWGPTLVVIDESQKYCPERSSGDAESAQAIIDLCSQGRKRGLCTALVTQRLSKLHKDAAAELGNVFIGRTTLDVDMKRAQDILGMSIVERGGLRVLEDGRFFGVGPAMNLAGVSRFVSRQVTTTHPKAGQRHALAAPEPSAKIRRVLADFADLPQQAAEEVKNLDDAKRRIAQLDRELKASTKPVDERALAQAEARGEQRGRAEMAAAIKQAQTVLSGRDQRLAGIVKLAQNLGSTVARIGELAHLNGEAIANPPAAKPQPIAVAKQPQVRPSAPKTVSPAVPTSNNAASDRLLIDLSRAQQRVLDAIGWWGSVDCPQPSRHQVAFAAGYTVNGHFNNLCGELRSQGLIEYPIGDHLCFTDAGASVANLPSLPPDLDEFHARIRAKLSNAQRRLFETLLAAHLDGSEPLSAEDFAQRSGYTVNGHFNNLRGELRSLGLAQYVSGGTRASDLVFPEGLS